MPEIIDELVDALSSCRFRFVTEIDLQDGIEKRLKEKQIQYCREYQLTKKDRPDFFIDGVVIEVKTKHNLSSLLRQIGRYIEHDDVKSVLVVGTPYWISQVPGELSGKPIKSVRLIGSLL